MAGVLVTAGPSFAKSTKTPVDFWQVNCLVDPGIDWVSDDGILHGRGRIEEFVFYAQDPATMAGEIVGIGVSVGNANIDLATGDGRIFGTVSVIYLPVSTTETFDGRYQGGLTASGVLGQGISHGSGEARNQKLKLDFESAPPPQWLLEELPNACPADKPLSGIVHNAGFLHKPRGD